MTLTLVLVVLIALLFDFTNGFHDTANSIATLVGTRALDPKKAVIMASALNFAGAFVSLKVAATIGAILDPNVLNQPNGLDIVMAGLTGAIVWNLATWALGIPSSSSHALVGGLIGAGLAGAGSGAVQWQVAVDKVLKPSVIAPLLGLVVALFVAALLMRMFKDRNPGRSKLLFKRMQLLSGGWLAFTHGTNDAQKTMGIMAAALVATHHLDPHAVESGHIPTWIILSAASAMAMGTYAGGWKIIKTLGGKVVKINPLQGFAASASSAAILQTAAHFGFPVSTTHVVSGSVMGAGASRRLSSVRWGVAGDIVTAWVLTLPCAALVGATAYALVSVHPAVLLFAAAALTLGLNHRMRRSGVAAH